MQKDGVHILGSMPIYRLLVLQIAQDAQYPGGLRLLFDTIGQSSTYFSYLGELIAFYATLTGFELVKEGISERGTWISSGMRQAHRCF